MDVPIAIRGCYSVKRFQFLTSSFWILIPGS